MRGLGECLGLLEGSDACSSSICRFSRTLLPQEGLLQAVAALHANFCLQNCTLSQCDMPCRRAPPNYTKPLVRAPFARPSQREEPQEAHPVLLAIDLG